MVVDADGASIENVFYVIVNLPRLLSTEALNIVMFAM
jgi:hypothetical protein